MDALEVIEHEIQKIRGRKTSTASNLNICCPFHEGDVNPSLGIYIVPNGEYPVGTFYCLGCGTRGSWNKLAAKLNLKLLTEQDRLQKKIDASVQNLLNKFDKNLLPSRKLYYSVPDGALFPDKEWRGIKGSLVRKLQGYIDKHPYLKNHAVINFPVVVESQLVTVVSALFERNKALTSYTLGKNSMLKQRALFPYDYVFNQAPKIVCVVEGPRDALRLIQEGVMAVALLGATNWSKSKGLLLKRLVNLYDTTIVLVLDGDKPGTKARLRISQDLKSLTITPKVLKLDKVCVKKKDKRKGIESYDPFNMPRKYVKLLKKL